jgi:hypothetical protein
LPPAGASLTVQAAIAASRVKDDDGYGGAASTAHQPIADEDPFDRRAGRSADHSATLTGARAGW